LNCSLKDFSIQSSEAQCRSEQRLCTWYGAIRLWCTVHRARTITLSTTSSGCSTILLSATAAFRRRQLHVYEA